MNKFRNQIAVTKANTNSKSTKIFFKKYIRHVIEYSDIENINSIFEISVNSTIVYAICCDVPTLARIQNHILETFLSIKFVHTKGVVIDLTNQNDQLEAAHCEHNCAHRCANENFKQLLGNAINKHCRICMENKCIPPLPEYPGQILHIDIFFTIKAPFLKCFNNSRNLLV